MHESAVFSKGRHGQDMKVLLVVIALLSEYVDFIVTCPVSFKNERTDDDVKW